MIDVTVPNPTKTDGAYRFDCPVKGQKSFAFGFESINYKLRHHWVWDSVFPALFLAHAGSPIIEKRHTKASVQFAYPIHEAALAFLLAHAKTQAADLTVKAETFSRPADIELRGEALAFGGGKESRLSLGILRELGEAPSLVHAMIFKTPLDVPGCLYTKDINGTIVSLIMPTLMLAPQRFYYGSSMLDKPYHFPWHCCYTFGSPEGLKMVSGFLAAVGLPMSMLSATSVLPTNLVQKLLHVRYPELAKGQISTFPNADKEKNLHIALIKMLHGIPYESHCPDVLLRKLAARFIRNQTLNPADWAYRNFRQTVRLEMRAILHRLRSHRVFSGLPIPDSWADVWPDYVHEYVDPTCPPGAVSIMHEHAPSIETAPRGTFRCPMHTG